MGRGKLPTSYLSDIMICRLYIVEPPAEQALAQFGAKGEVKVLNRCSKGNRDQIVFPFVRRQRMS